MKNRPYPLYHYLPELHSLRQMLQIKASARPDDVAVTFMPKRKSLVEKTYRELFDDVRWLGSYLLKRGVRGRHIAIMSENSYHYLISYLAIVITGNVAVLLSKDYTSTEVSVLMNQTDTDIIVSSKACLPAVEGAKKQVSRMRIMSMEDMDKWLETGRKFYERGRNIYDVKSDDLDRPCTIFFTSGTSGNSKAVLLSQRNITSDINFSTQNFCPSDGSVMAVLPFNHAFGLVTSTLMPIHYGKPLFINSSLADFMKEIPIAKPGTLFLVPLFVETFSKTIWRTIRKQGKETTVKRGLALSNAMLKLGIDKRQELFAEILKKFGGNLKYIICGGAPLDPHYVKEFRGFGIEVLNGYGITECAPVLSVNRNHYFRDGSVGQILNGVTIRVYEPDEKGIGEIQVKGTNVMLGYYHDETATEDAFCDGWYRTGDLGYVDKDGFLFITGRAKNLIILANGENVSPEELEQVIALFPEVGEVVCYEENGAITAEIFPDDTLEIDGDEARERIEEQIKAYNAKAVSHKKIHKIRFRNSEFEKTATKKIKRYQVGKKK